MEIIFIIYCMAYVLVTFFPYAEKKGFDSLNILQYNVSALKVNQEVH